MCGVYTLAASDRLVAEGSAASGTEPSRYRRVPKVMRLGLFLLVSWLIR
jgi:hypothetical protein